MVVGQNHHIDCDHILDFQKRKVDENKEETENNGQKFMNSF